MFVSFIGDVLSLVGPQPFLDKDEQRLMEPSDCAKYRAVSYLR